MIYLLSTPTKLQMNWFFKCRDAAHYIGPVTDDLVTVLKAATAITALDATSKEFAEKHTTVEVTARYDVDDFDLNEDDVVITLNIVDESIMSWKEYFGPCNANTKRRFLTT